MSQKTFVGLTTCIFALLGILHLLRIINSWPAQIGNFVVPLWLSWIALIVAAIIAGSGFKLLKRN